MKNTASGILLVTSIDEGRTKETETFTCCHCGRVKFLSRDKSKSQDGGWCFKCAQLLCQTPRCHSNCEPYKKRIGA